MLLGRELTDMDFRSLIDATSEDSVDFGSKRLTMDKAEASKILIGTCTEGRDEKARFHIESPPCGTGDIRTKPRSRLMSGGLFCSFE